jgi:hypothetical protein
MKLIARILPILLFLFLLPAPANADTTPRADMTQGAAKPASTTFVGSETPAKATNKWINCQKGDCTGLKVVNVTNHTNRDGVVVDVCPSTVKGCAGVIPSNITITDSDFYLTAPATGTNYPWAVQVVNGHDVVLDGVRGHNFRMAPVNGKYTNGDVFDGERGSYNVTFRNTVADGASDAGYDFKGTNYTFDNAEANDVDICITAWGQGVGVGVFACKNWGPTSSGAAIQVVKLSGSTGTPGNLHLAELHLEPPVGATVKVFNLQYPGATLVVDKCSGTWPANDGKNKLVTYEQGATATNTTLTLPAVCGLGYVDPPPAIVQAAPPPVTGTPQLFWPDAAPLVDKTPGDNRLTVSTTSNWKKLGAKGPVTVETPPEAFNGGWLYTPAP